MEHMISFQNLEVSPYVVEQLLDVRVDHQINEHSTFYFRALLPEEKKDSYVKDSSQGCNVSLLTRDAAGDRDILFQGMVQDIKVEAIQGSYYIEVYAISYSYLLDVEKKSRSFQDKKMPYGELTQQVASDYADAKIKDVVTHGADIGQLIVQYKETDWEFLKRLVSHFHTGLVNDVHFDCPRCYFGIPQREKRTLEISQYDVKKDLGKYLKLSKSGISGLREQDFIYYQVETYLPLNIGDKVQFQGQTLYVYQIRGRMEKGIFVHYLTLTTKKGMCQPYQWNERIVGGSLNAKVVDVHNDQVKVSLEVDEASGHTPGKLCFFPYSTIYSSQDGSGWYCMPEIGDHVRIYFPDGIEEHGYAISSVHQEMNLPMQQSDDIEGSSNSNGGDYSGQRDDPNVKSIRNKDGKEIRLTPDGIYIIAEGTTITLTDDGGISILSDQNIEFKSEQSIILSAEEDVSIIGQTGIDINCNETASIKMQENVEVIGQEVKAN